ncbi:MAG: PAS domain S-box protein [Flavisolibacter sp.]|nr:PAS domain S-box protein [Flavisolibacter sp.]
MIAIPKSYFEQERTELLYNLLMQTPVAIVVFSGPDYVIKLANDSYVQLTGKNREELLDRPAFEVMPVAVAQGFIELLDKIRATGEPVHLHEHKTLIERRGKIDTTYLNIVYQPLKEMDGRVDKIMIVTTDVTEQVNARQKTEEYAEQLRIALEGGDLGYYNYYPQSGQLIWSDRTKEMFGLPPDAEADYSIFLKGVHPEDRQRSDAAVQKAMNPASNGMFENEYRTVGITDGKIRWIHSKGKIFFDKQGKAIRFTGITQDITKQKNDEEKIKTNEHRYRQIFEGTPVSIWEKDLSRVYAELQKIKQEHQDVKTFLNQHPNEVYRLMSMVKIKNTNEASLKMFDADHKEELLKDISVLFTEETIPVFIEEMVAMANKEESFESEYILQTLKARKINCLVKTKLPQNEDYSCVLVSRFDITDRKRAEEAIKQREEELRTLANSIQNLAWMADGEGWIYWYNQRWYEYTGTTQEEMQGWGWQKVHHPDHIDNVLTFVKDAWKKDEPWELTFPLRSKSGEYRWFLTRANPVKNAEGKVYRWIGTNTDIDDQKTIEEKLEKLVSERTKELQHSNEDLQQFAHVASHDLKEPVRKIMTFSNRLNYEFGNLIPEKGKLYLDRLENAAGRIYQMIDSILLYSSLDATKHQKERIDLTETFNEIISDLEVFISEKNAEITYGKLPVIEGFPILIYQLFYNLLNNALKFSKPNEKPLIEVFCEIVDCRESNCKYARIILKDNGIGFNQNEAEIIFKTFTRLHSKDNYEGTGLGLALCRKIVERHRGSISAEGIAGQGATFTITLPIKSDDWV